MLNNFTTIEVRCCENHPRMHAVLINGLRVTGVKCCGAWRLVQRFQVEDKTLDQLLVRVRKGRRVRRTEAILARQAGKSDRRSGTDRRATARRVRDKLGARGKAVVR